MTRIDVAEGDETMYSQERVELISRNDDCDELQEMQRFLAEAEQLAVDHLLVRLFYDSKACLCIIDTVTGAPADHHNAVLLTKAARRHISQFELFGVIGHR